MVNLLDSFKGLHPVKVGVIGDFVVDKYIFGSVGRISPEAPVPVVLAEEIKYVPGMAGNVALNLQSLGASVYLFGRIGIDAEGELFVNYLKDSSIITNGVVQEEGYRTPLKERVISQSQQLLRVDYEQTTALKNETQQKILSQLKEAIPYLDLIALSDYQKGLLTFSFVQKIIEISKEFNVKVIVDPKGKDFTKYKGAFMIKPNLNEAYLAANMERQVKLGTVASYLLEQSLADHLLITRSEEGMSLFSNHLIQQDFPVMTREVKDVTGAGDTVLSMLSLGIANHLPLDAACILANIAASLVIQKIGCARVTLSEIAESILQKESFAKVFEERHLYALHQILSKHDFVILIVEKESFITQELFKSIKQAKELKNHKLLVYVDDSEAIELLLFLSSLQDVDYILKSRSDLSHLLGNLKPQKAYRYSSSKLFEVKKPVELLHELLAHSVT